MSNNKIKDPSKSDRRLGWKEIEIAGIIKGATSKNNKTGSWKSFKPVVDSEKCIGCMKCYEFCPDNSVIPKERNDDSNMKYYIDSFKYDFCKGCGICSNICPVSAIEMKRSKGDDNE